MPCWGTTSCGRAQVPHRRIWMDNSLSAPGWSPWLGGQSHIFAISEGPCLQAARAPKYLKIPYRHQWFNLTHFGQWPYCLLYLPIFTRLLGLGMEQQKRTSDSNVTQGKFPFQQSQTSSPDPQLLFSHTCIFFFFNPSFCIAPCPSILFPNTHLFPPVFLSWIALLYPRMTCHHSLRPLVSSNNISCALKWAKRQKQQKRTWGRATNDPGLLQIFFANFP